MPPRTPKSFPARHATSRVGGGFRGQPEVTHATDAPVLSYSGQDESTCAHQVLRPGMTVCWRNGTIFEFTSELDDCRSLGRAELVVPDATFVYVLRDKPAPLPSASLADSTPGAGGWMCVLPHSDLEALRAQSRGASFQLVIRLNASVMRELFGGEVGGGTMRLLESAMPPHSEHPQLHSLSPAVRLALESIRRCPMASACRCLILAARCHDLLLEFVSALQTVSPVARPILSQTEERVRQAAELLGRQLDQTPSLGKLARDVGLSETTLKRAFRQIFGETVFEHLRGLRMERARTLLHSGQATVIEAATQVGYSNPSNFAAAFRRQFGLNPKTFQLAARR